MEATPIYCKNPSCPDRSAPLAATDGTALYVGRAVMERPVTLLCSACRCRVYWEPRRMKAAAGVRAAIAGPSPPATDVL